MDAFIECPKEYALNSLIYSGIRSKVYHAKEKTTGQQVYIKAAQQFSQSCLLNEHRVLKELSSIPGVIKVVGFKANEYIILEDFGGQSLRHLLQQNGPWKYKVDEFLEIAIKITEILGQIHEHHIIHRDLKPDNILWNPESSIAKIGDFGSASIFASINGTNALNAPRSLAVTMAYTAPEGLKGRVDYTIDHRSDFYSLGITFFELLTGQHPFEATTTTDIVYEHLARDPPKLSTLEPKYISTCLSDIIKKMMAKPPCERYQSAEGIIRDLEHCKSCWIGSSHNSEHAEFVPGRFDVSRVFKIPVKLYGREREKSQLIQCVEYAKTHKNENSVVLVSGCSGVGKTSLVQIIKKTPDTYFVAGKFTMSNQNVPYSALIEAIDSLIEQVLFEEESVLSLKRIQLREQLGSNAQILATIIPKLNTIIGTQNMLSISGLNPTEMQNVLVRYFKILLCVLSGQSIGKHQMVILYLDDLQWADASSIAIIEALLVTEVHLLFAGSYRDNEIPQNLSAMKFLNSLEHRPLKITAITLGPLSIEAIQTMICESVHTTIAKAKCLATIVLEKTQGNPLFVERFLYEMYRKQLLYFDSYDSAWKWDPSKARMMVSTENVVEFLVEAMTRLPKSTLSLIQLGSCFGNTFSIRHIAGSFQQDLSQAQIDIWHAEKEGYVRPLKNLVYTFMHDRIQQAAYSMMSIDDQVTNHIKIGLYLKSVMEKEGNSDYIFDVVSHLNKFPNAIVGYSQRIEMAQLNLTASIKARESLAFSSAKLLAESAQVYLPNNPWEQEYELTYNLHFELAVDDYLNKDYNKAEILFNEIENRTNDIFQKVKIYEKRAALKLEKMEYRDSVNTAVECVRLLGIQISSAPLQEEIEEEVKNVYKLLGTRQITKLQDMKEMSDDKYLAAVTVLGPAIPSAFFVDVDLALYISAKVTCFSLQYGNAVHSIYAYIIFGWLERTQFDKKIENSYEWGALALNLCNRYARENQALAMQAKVWLTHGALTCWMKEPTASSLEYSMKSHRMAIEAGDYAYACYSCYHILYFMYMLKPLDEFGTYGKSITDYAKNSLADDHRITSESVALSVLKLKTGDDTFSGPAMELEIKRRHPFTGAIYYITRMKTHFILAELDLALQTGDLAKPLVKYVPGFYEEIDYYFYRSLTLLAIYSQRSASDQEIFMKEVQINLDFLGRYAEACPQNLSHRYTLLEAEICRVTGSPEALNKYLLAIEQAEQSECLSETALASELAAKYHQFLSEKHYQDASKKYAKWGAKYKCNTMRDQTKREAATPPTTPYQTQIQETSYFSSSELDLEAVIASSQELSSIVDVEQLCNTLLRIVVKNAGATKGVLLFDKDGLVVQTAISGSNITLDAVPLDKCPYLSASIVNYCWRTQKAVLVSDVPSTEPYSNDPYLCKERICSLLCTPLSYKERFTGLIYLENDINYGIFTEDRLRVINILGSQLMISLENAMLVDRLKHNSIELTEKNEALKELDKMKDEFLAMTSHEFRTPLNGVIGMTALLNETQLNSEQQDYVHHISNSAESLLVLVTDILDFARLQAKKFRLEEAPFFITECVESALGIVEYAAVAKELNVAYVVDTNLIDAVIGDRSRMKQILINLLNNAIKFTNSGEVTISVRTISSNEKTVTTEFSVKDTGIGIDEKELNLLFKPFSQASSSYTRTYTGSGLGLVICKSLCELMNGTIGVESERGKGSNFTFSVTFSCYNEARKGDDTPLCPADSNFMDYKVTYESDVQTIKSHSHQIEGCHIYTKCHTVNAQAIKSHLDPLGIQTRIYSDPEEFLQLLTATHKATPLLITDFDSASQFIDKISASRYTVVVMVSIILKKLGDPLAASNLLYLHLPLRRSQLFAVIRKLTNQEVSPSKGATEQAPGGTNMTILVVEDNLINQKIVVRMLTNLGYNVEAVGDGNKAIEAYKKRLYDIILMDVHMPICNGLDATRTIRKIEAETGNHVPIIAVTASVADQSICNQAGMDDFIAKPISKASFLCKMDKWAKKQNPM